MASPHALSTAFEPASIAVIGASEQVGSVGRLLLHNLRDSGYRGQLFAINPKYEQVGELPCHPSIEALGRAVDLALIATPARLLPGLILECGRQGVRNVAIISATTPALEQRIAEAARHARVRVLGPGSLGMARPGSRINAALTPVPISSGDIALISQSGAMCSVILDWAQTNGIGFSTVISLGGSLDIDFGESLDYLAHDPQTRYILLYLDRVNNARQLLSALRSAARVKPVILLKAGRHGSTARQTQAAHADPVFDAAMRRAGVVRVQGIDQLFFATKALASGFRPRDKRLAIISNGRAPAQLASDRAHDLGVELVALGSPTIASLERLGGRERQQHNPLDLGGDAEPARWREALLSLAEDGAVSTVLIILSPHALVDPIEVAQEVIDLAAQLRLKLYCCWMGGGQVAEARQQLDAAGIPVFSSPEAAVELFHDISRFQRSQTLLLQTAGGASALTRQRAESARVMMEAVLGQRRDKLSAMESKALLRSFGVPVTRTIIAHDATEALFVAEQCGFPVVMKVDTDALPSKSAAGGVRLNLNSAEAVWGAYHDIIDSIARRHPELEVTRVTIEPYVYRPLARELRIRVFRDSVFGPVLSVAAESGTGAPWFALPPLNSELCQDLIEAALPGHNQGQALSVIQHKRAALEQVLIAVSDLVCELPALRELEISPLIVDDDGAIAADARILIDQGAEPGREPYAHMAIHPYPLHLHQRWQLAEGLQVDCRAVRPEDAQLLLDFFDTLSAESRYMRFMEEVDALTPAMLARFTQIDYDREMALVAICHDDGQEVMLGSARYALAADGESVEFALIIGDRWQRHGLGRRLMAALIDVARSKGYRSIFGEVLGSNSKMLQLMSRLGFFIGPHPEDSALRLVNKTLHAG